METEVEIEAKNEPRLCWASDVDRQLSAASIRALLKNEIPFLRIPRFATVDECESLVAGAAREGFGDYRAVEPRITRIGNTVFEYNGVSEVDYFESNQAAREVQKRIFGGSFDPVARFMQLLKSRTGFPVGVARNARNQPYYAGLIRRIEDGTLLHVDFAPHEQPDWDVGRITHQLAWNLYLRTRLQKDGATHIFNRQWRREDEHLKEGGYGYNPVVAEGAEEVVFEPEVGEIVIFNTRNFHYVEPTLGERVTVTSAIGLLQDRELVLWS